MCLPSHPLGRRDADQPEPALDHLLHAAHQREARLRERRVVGEDAVLVVVAVEGAGELLQ